MELPESTTNPLQNSDVENKAGDKDNAVDIFRYSPSWPEASSDKAKRLAVGLADNFSYGYYICIEPMIGPSKDVCLRRLEDNKMNFQVLKSLNKYKENAKFNLGASCSIDGTRLAVFYGNEKFIDMWSSSSSMSLVEDLGKRRCNIIHDDCRSYLHGHCGPVLAVAFNFDRKSPRLASVGSGKNTPNEDENLLKLIARYVRGMEKKLFPMFVEHETACIGEIIIWDEEFHQPERTIHVTTTSDIHEALKRKLCIETEIYSICWSPGSEESPGCAVACGGKYCVFVYDSRTGKQLCRPSEIAWREGGGDGDTANVIAWSPPWPDEAGRNISYIAVAVFNIEPFIHVFRCEADSKRIRVEKMEEIRTTPHKEEVTELSWRMEVGRGLLLLATSADRSVMWIKANDSAPFTKFMTFTKFDEKKNPLPLPLPLRPALPCLPSEKY